MAKNLLLVAVSAIFMVQIVWTLPPTKYCDGYVCYDQNNRPFRCEDRGYTCCRDNRDQGRILQQFENQFCCQGSGELFDPAHQVCENRAIRNKTENEEMCGWNAVYDTTTQACCYVNETFGRVFAKDPNGKCCNGSYITTRGVECCGKQAYHTSSHTCCVQQTGFQALFPVANGRCCLDAAYDPFTHNCTEWGVQAIGGVPLKQCNGVSYDSKNFLCCNGRTYNRNTTVCYRDLQAVLKMNPSDTKACELHNKTYETFSDERRIDGSRKACIPGQDIVTLSRNEGLCDDRIYNIHKDLCCGEELRRGGRKRRKECCAGGTNMYNPKKQTCCRNHVHDSIGESEGGRCCETKAYDSRTHQCNAERRIVPLPRDCQPKLLAAMKKTFKRGYFAYTATVTRQNSQNGDTAKWSLSNVLQLKGKRLKMAPAMKGKRNSKIEMEVTTKVSKCFQAPVAGQQYLVVTDKKLPHKTKSGKKTRRRARVPTTLFFPLTNDAELARTVRILLGVSRQ